VGPHQGTLYSNILFAFTENSKLQEILSAHKGLGVKQFGWDYDTTPFHVYAAIWILIRYPRSEQMYHHLTDLRLLTLKIFATAEFYVEQFVKPVRICFQGKVSVSLHNTGN